ncbi:regulatory protein GemA [Roseinatronobacter sp. NSM]|uniref:regulatory protein GemA n=1 Tax=Roseinatronobacter sp. NSM TaxID=3457785 RepID=UPI004034FEEA
MPLSKKQIRLIHVAKTKLGIEDGLYRSILANLCGVTSSTELDQAGFELLMGFFEYQGFRPMTRNGANYGPRPGMASYAQLELIRALWTEYSQGRAGESELNKWLERCFKLTSLRFLGKATAPKVITALKAMKTRAA